MDKQFPEGIYWNDKHPKAPDFIKGSISIKVEKAIPWLKANENNGGYVNITVKESRAGKTYLELNTYTPKKEEEATDTTKYIDEDGVEQEIPF